MRTTTKGLIENQTLVRVRNASSRRHARGTFVRTIGANIEYRSSHNGGLYIAPMHDVAVDRKQIKERRARAMKGGR